MTFDSLKFVRRLERGGFLTDISYSCQVPGEHEQGDYICRSTYSRSTSFMRVCQPGPVARKAAMTS